MPAITDHAQGPTVLLSRCMHKLQFDVTEVQVSPCWDISFIVRLHKNACRRRYCGCFRIRHWDRNTLRMKSQYAVHARKPMAHNWGWVIMIRSAFCGCSQPHSNHSGHLIAGLSIIVHRHAVSSLVIHIFRAIYASRSASDGIN
jgi:hypothetical protein